MHAWVTVFWTACSARYPVTSLVRTRTLARMPNNPSQGSSSPLLLRPPPCVKWILTAGCTGHNALHLCMSSRMPKMAASALIMQSLNCRNLVTSRRMICRISHHGLKESAHDLHQFWLRMGRSLLKVLSKSWNCCCLPSDCGQALSCAACCGCSYPPCTLEEMQAVFNLRMHEAAEHFGMKPTAFKKRCRAAGLHNWPFRQHASVQKVAERIAGVRHADPTVSDASNVCPYIDFDNDCV